MSIFPRNSLGLSLCNFLCFFLLLYLSLSFICPSKTIRHPGPGKKKVFPLKWQYDHSNLVYSQQSTNQTIRIIIIRQQLIVHCGTLCRVFLMYAGVHFTSICIMISNLFVCLFWLVACLVGEMVGVLLCGPRVPWGRICISLYSSQG